MISGALLIDKSIGKTSREEVNFISKKLNEKKAGHIGTLDPFADGLLIVLLGRSTKISPYLEGMDKDYLATLKLGEMTDTGDLTGKVIDIKEIPPLSKERINDVFASFIGKQKQLPPMYSAIKINGKELYKYARKGEEIERKEREINIYSLNLISLNKDEIVFLTKVSKGTYIRTLGEDIAKALGTVGHLTKLTRTRIGPYSLEKAVKSDDVSLDKLILTEEMLSFIPSIMVDEELSKKIQNGMHVKLDTKEMTILVKDKDGAIAIYSHDHKDIYKCERGLR